LVEVAEYAVVNKLVEEPAFKWWVPHVICRRNWIISKVKSRYWKTTHKFGICLPKTVKEALEIDRVTNTDFWRQAVKKEMAKVKIALATHDGHTLQQVREGKVPQFIGFQDIGCHIVQGVQEFLGPKCHVGETSYLNKLWAKCDVQGCSE
jgi:hypothetical protein